MKTKFILFFITLCFISKLFALTLKTEPIPVVVSVPPQVYFVEKIAQHRAHTTVIVPQGFEPEDYEPRPQKLKALTHAKLYLAIDVPFETTWLKKFQQISPNMKIVLTHKGIQKMEMSDHAHHFASSATIKDPHIWLSPKLALIQAKNIQDAFIEIDPKYASFYRENYLRLVEEIKQLDDQIKLLFNQIHDKKNRIFFILHPSLGYFALDYKLTQVPIEKEGKPPTLKQLNDIVSLAKQNNIKTVFITPEYSPKTAEVVASAIEGKTQLIDPLSSAWSKNLKQLAFSIFQSLQNKD